jgi:lysozyme
MTINQKGIDLIKHFESLHDGDLTKIGLQPKQCPAGIWTIGFGHALKTTDKSRFLKGSADKKEAYRQSVEVFHMMTEEDAEALLNIDLQVYADNVTRAIRGKIELSENEFAAVVSFDYNCGDGNLKVSTLLKKILAGDDAGAADEFLKWNKATVNGKKVVLRGLTLRRQAERALYLEK